jgi:hypothetical protein
MNHVNLADIYCSTTEVPETGAVTLCAALRTFYSAIVDYGKNKIKSVITDKCNAVGIIAEELHCF